MKTKKVKTIGPKEFAKLNNDPTLILRPCEFAGAKADFRYALDGKLYTKVKFADYLRTFTNSQLRIHMAGKRHPAQMKLMIAEMTRRGADPKLFARMKGPGKNDTAWVAGIE